MQQSGEYRLAASRAEVWRALNDVNVLQACIDGCQSMQRIDEQRFEAAVKAKIGPVSATFATNIELSDLVPPESYTLSVNVKGGAAGFGKGTARVELAEDHDATIMRYTVDGTVGGKLAQIGSRLIDGATRKMTDDFFAQFSETVAPGSEKTSQPPDAAELTERTERSGQRLIWIIVFAVLLVALLFAL